MFKKNGHHLKIQKKQQILHLILLHLIPSKLFFYQQCFICLHSEHKQNIFPSVWAFMNMFPENVDFSH